ncbi:hemerythrin domain-containing protein [Rhodococcus rhodochrous]|uniref:hemerythrin domain-containing protein n=1 Tax=Rhodococcus rhodochrous TaxID=1829 RepID=UPI0007508FBE|nr:hemerythrin domain-containing protein [Rhodococcus rhodochrous]MCB8910171.1 hemerythrin domain-containing protein [Rhodococcus rhodochrous]MDJ0398626.1 hemerythrin domain-containing protein [Rhodococcus rhodochrous]MDO1485610.1 hemerythrin domain-containing protein [Rhodococcus rhodochrous]SNV25108.1 Alr3199 protein [Rhodococcus rhodochrous]
MSSTEGSADSHDTAQDVVTILTEDHREMLELLGRAETTLDAEERRDLTDSVIAEVMRHSVAEEMFVYPEMEKHLPGGTEAVEHDKKEHDEIVQVMKQLEGADASSAEFTTLVKKLQELLKHHADDEEPDQFPALRAHLGHDTLVEVGTKVQAAKKLAPTRPHPSAPHSELFHKTVGPGVGMVDRLRDALTGRNT